MIYDVQAFYNVDKSFSHYAVVVLDDSGEFVEFASSENHSLIEWALLEKDKLEGSV